MQSADYTVSPAEVEVLKKYIESLKADSFYTEELNSKETSYHALAVARRIIEFHVKWKVEGGQPRMYKGRHVEVDYLSESSKHDYALKVLLHDSGDIIEFWADEYLKRLQNTDRHYVLSKFASEMTGYDIKEMISYILEDARNRSGQSQLL